MTPLTVGMWLVSGTALLLSIGACIAIALLSHRYRSTSAGRLSAQLSEMQLLQEEHARAISRLRQRLNLKAYRETKEAPEASEGRPSTATSDDPGEADRLELSRRIARGEFGRR